MTSKKQLIAEYVQGKDIPIPQLDLTPRAYNALRANGISFFSDILILDYREIKSLPFMSASIAREIDMCKKYFLHEYKEWLSVLLAVSNDDSDTDMESVSQPSIHINEETIITAEEKKARLFDSFIDSVQSADDFTPVEILNLNTRAFYCLKRANIHAMQFLHCWIQAI